MAQNLYNNGSVIYPNIDNSVLANALKKTDTIVMGANAYPCIALNGNSLSVRGDVLFTYSVSGGTAQYIKFSSSGATVKYNLTPSNALVLDATKVDATKVGTSNPMMVDAISGLVSVVNIGSIKAEHIVLAYNSATNSNSLFGAFYKLQMNSILHIGKVHETLKSKFNILYDENGNVSLPSLFIACDSKDINHKDGVATLGKTYYENYAMTTQEGKSFLYLDTYKIYFEGKTTLDEVVVHGGASKDAMMIPLLVRGKTSIGDKPIISGSLVDYLEYMPTLSVFNNYPNQLNELGFLTKKGYGSSTNNLSFGWISDGHGDKLFDADKAVDASDAEFLVYTGDMVTQSYQDNISNMEAQALTMAKPCFLMIGNHDHWKAPSLQAMYDRWVAPLAEKNGVSNGKLYYSKDYTAKKVKCIFLNDFDVAPSATNYMYSTYSQEQIEWFINELKAASASGLHVAIFRHLPAFNGEVENEMWTERHFKGALSFGGDEVRNPDGNGVSAYNPIPYIIKAWKESGTYNTSYNGFTINADFTTTAAGNFIAYFCGHTHGDSVHKSLGQISIGITQPNEYQERTDLWKNTKYWHEINFVQIDTNNKEVHIMRLGQRNTYNGYVRNFLCVKY